MLYCYYDSSPRAYLLFMRQSHLHVILFSLLLVSCAGASARAQTGEPNFVVTTKNADDQVEITYEPGKAWIDIHSATGIGSATFMLEAGDMPGEIILRLHLQGLEELRFTSGEESISASISSSDPSSIHQTLITTDQESPLLPVHPLWMPIEIVSMGGEKKIPLKEGYFQVVVPEEFLQKAGTSFAVQWIDFYR